MPIVVLLLLTLAACDWVAYRGNAAHTGYLPGESAISVDNVGTLHEAWTTAPFTSADPTIAKGHLYVPASGGLQVYDVSGADGCGEAPCEPVWRAEVFGRTPAVVRGVVYVAAGGADSGALYAFDAAGETNCSGTPRTCVPLWTAPVDATFVAPPTVAGGVVVVAGVGASGANHLETFDAAGQRGCSGAPRVCEPLWSADYGSTVSELAGDMLQRSPAIAYGRIFASGADNKVYIFDQRGATGCGGTPRTCSALWIADPGLTCEDTFFACGISAPVVANATLFVTGRSDIGGAGPGGLFAFDAGGSTSCSGHPRTCSPLWTGPGESFAPPAVAKGIVYAVGRLPRPPLGEGSRLRAFDATGTTGCSGAPKVCSPLWTSTVELDTTDSLLTYPPSVANGVVYALGFSLDCEFICLATRNVLAFDATGSSGCTGPPRQCTPLLDVESTGLDSGSVLGRGDPIIGDGVLYVTDRVVHALTPR